MPKKKRRPYEGTSVDWMKTQHEISYILKKYGAKGVQWTDIPSPHDPQVPGEINVKWLQEVEIEGVMKRMMIHVKTPIVQRDRTFRRDRPTAKQYQQDVRESFRAVYYWIKSGLEAVYEYPLQHFEDIFMSYVTTFLKDPETGKMLIDANTGQPLETTVGEAIKGRFLERTDMQIEAPHVKLLHDGEEE